MPTRRPVSPSGFGLAACLALACGAAGAVQAQSYEQALDAARAVDAQFAAQRAGVDGRRAQSRQAGTAYYPSGAVAYNQADVSANGRSTRSVSLTQPLISYDRYLTLQQADPLAALAEAELAQAQADLAVRVFAAMADVVRNREQIRALAVQIAGLEEQLRRAGRMRELGQGTVTDVADFRVRVAVAQANSIGLRNALQAADRNFTLLTGLRGDIAAMQADVPAWRDPRPLDQLIDEVRSSAPAARSARMNLALAEIARQRVKAQYLPQVSAQLARVATTGAGGATGGSADTSRIAITLTAPIGFSPYYDDQRAAAEALRTQEALRFVQDGLATEVTRLDAAIRSYRDEYAVRQQAVDSARLSVDANVRSYQGGVKTNIDVVTSYQLLADAEAALVNTRLLSSEAELRLALLAGR
ncbi:hypothetical protein GN316_18070 [Xylophilus sp. Kf1]|nr:hypothetical protein [Xylophilus sp. Kf1]